MLAREHFTVYPALDVLEGRVVRLREGRREQVTVEGGDPVAAAQRFVAEGAGWLHLVDLDGAFSGQPDLGLVSRVAAAGVPCRWEVGTAAWTSSLRRWRPALVACSSVRRPSTTRS